MKRYPVSSLAREMGLSENAALEQLGVRGKDAQEYKRRGVTERVADRLAAKAGLPTLSVWPEMVDERVAEVERICAECGVRFVAHARHPRQRYCSRLCVVRANGRSEASRAASRRYAAKRAEDPEYRAARAEYLREYRRRYGSRINAQRRRQRRASA